MRAIKVLSLFDGISCARVALDRLGYAVEYYASEIDKYAISIAQKNYPDTIQLGSVTDLDFSLLPAEIDLLIGGSPCQDLSIAKANRKGLDGERSGLFWEYVRILKEVKPKYFVLENVNSMPKDAKRIISETLGVEPIMINAALVSAQNRKRLFWVGKLVGDTYEQVKIELPEDRGILLRDILEPKVDDKYIVKDKSNTIRTSGRGSGIDDKHNWDTIRIGQLNSGGQGDRIYSKDGKSVALSANGGGRGAKTGLYAVTEPVCTMDNAPQSGWVEEKDENGERYDIYITQRGRGFNKGGDRARDGKAPTLSANSWEDNNHIVIRTVPGNKAKTLGTNQQCETAVAGQSVAIPEATMNYTIRKLTPVECERLMTLPDKYTEGISNTQRYKCLGNGFVVEVVKHILSYMEGLKR